MSISRMSRGPAILAIAAVSLIFAACRERSDSRATSSPPPDIILITVDTLRADALGYAGNSRVATPNIDRLAREGRVFTQAHAHNVMTLPSHANILTGRLPYEHGIRDNEGFRLDSKIATLATVLHGAGYATGA